MRNKRLEDRRKRIPKDVDIYVERSFQIVDRIHQILVEQGKDQKTLAKALGKSESEISKWMTGTHNFTLKSLSKIEAVLGQPVLEVTGRTISQEKFTFIDQFFFTWQKKTSRQKTANTPNKDYSYIPMYQEPSEILS
jgi:transcriptional regulator with XRE-family HTH domain